MRKFCWQRWTLICLLMARLVLGELGHAMPMPAMSAPEHASSEMAGDPACAEQESGATSHHADATDDAGTHSGGQHDCCKSGDCECPCLHVPCAALDPAVMSAVATTSINIPDGSAAVTSPRPSGLFRPPA